MYRANFSSNEDGVRKTIARQSVYRTIIFPSAWDVLASHCAEAHHLTKTKNSGYKPFLNLEVFKTKKGCRDQKSRLLTISCAQQKMRYRQYFSAVADGVNALPLLQHKDHTHNFLQWRWSICSSTTHALPQTIVFPSSGMRRFSLPQHNRRRWSYRIIFLWRGWCEYSPRLYSILSNTIFFPVWLGYSYLPQHYVLEAAWVNFSTIVDGWSALHAESRLWDQPQFCLSLGWPHGWVTNATSFSVPISLPGQMVTFAHSYWEIIRHATMFFPLGMANIFFLWRRIFYLPWFSARADGATNVLT